jgi:hypothetical protein
MSYQDDVSNSHGLRATERKNASTEAARNTADINHALRMITASRTYHVKNGAYSYLIRLGGDPPAGSCTADDS